MTHVEFLELCKYNSSAPSCKRMYHNCLYFTLLILLGPWVFICTLDGPYFSSQFVSWLSHMDTQWVDCYYGSTLKKIVWSEHYWVMFMNHSCLLVRLSIWVTPIDLGLQFPVIQCIEFYAVFSYVSPLVSNKIYLRPLSVFVWRLISKIEWWICLKTFFRNLLSFRKVSRDFR